MLHAFLVLQTIRHSKQNQFKIAPHMAKKEAERGKAFLSI